MDNVTPEEHLLILMTYSKLDNFEKKEAKQIVSNIKNWEEFWQLSYDNRVAPLVKSNLEAIDSFQALPETIQQKFISRTKTVREANERRLNVAGDFLKKFEEQNIPVIILKGANFAETIYKNSSYRRMNDIDILIRKEDLDKIYDVYEEMTFFCLSELFGRSPRKQEKISHHAPSFISRDMACVIGTHWGLITPKAPYKYDYDAIWSRTNQFDFCGTSVLSMSPEDNLHHICVHLPFYKAGLKEIADIYNIIRHYGDKIDWKLFLKTVANAKTEEPVFHALSLATKICPLAACRPVIKSLRKGCSTKSIAESEKRIQHIDVVLRSRSIHMARVEKAFNEMNTTEKAKEKRQAFAVMWKNLFFPPREDIIKMNAFKNPGIVDMVFGFFYTPWLISKVFIHDLGAGIYVAILLKSIYDVLKYSANALINGESDVIDIATFAGRIGVTMDDLQRLKDSQE